MLNILLYTSAQNLQSKLSQLLELDFEVSLFVGPQADCLFFSWTIR